MRAMVLRQQLQALVAERRPVPEPAAHQVLVRVSACGVCRTDLHVVDGDLAHPKLPLVPGHEIVGHVVRTGLEGRHRPGQRVGIPWLGHTCGRCSYCRGGRENLCAEARFTGYDHDSGYADYVVADERYVFAIDGDQADDAVAPWLCAGLIGYRSLRRAGEPALVGLYGFAAAAHIVIQVARFEGRRVFAFTLPGDTTGQQFARSLGAEWVGESSMASPEPLDAAIILAPVSTLVPIALANLRPGGRVVCAGIHMSAIPEFSYDLLWREREIVSVANLTRADGEAFLALAPTIPVRTSVVRYPLAGANEALADLRAGRLNGGRGLAARPAREQS